MNLTNKEIQGYLQECLGYDDLMIEGLKENYKGIKLSTLLNEEELEDCINYYL